MSNRVVFRTPTLLDMEAFSVFGVSSKPNTNNPIGYFGTGLKYAVAVLLRESISISIFVGQTECVFYKKAGKFRDKNYEQIMLKKRGGILSRWQYQQLPFTTQLGRNWELWQVLRELHSNTLDENGESYVAQHDVQEDWWTDGPEDGVTKIVVTSDEFLAEFHKIDQIFLPGSRSSNSSWDGKQQAEIFSHPSEHVYYRGLRVFDMPKGMKSNFTYNILAPLELTEDRTVKYDFYMYRAICDQLAICDDPDIARVVASSDEDTFEGRIDWDWCSVEMEPIMLDAVRRYGRKNSRVALYATRYDTPVPAPRTWVDDLVDAIESGSSDDTWELIDEHRSEVVELLRGGK